jgi:putative FmdB family regulatory protein
MPAYDFRCRACGPFEEVRPLAEASTPARCPGCASPARRVYTAPGFSVRGGALRDASTAMRQVMDRASSGEPVITGPPVGRRLPAGPHVH